MTVTKNEYYVIWILRDYMVDLFIKEFFVKLGYSQRFQSQFDQSYLWYFFTEAEVLPFCRVGTANITGSTVCVLPNEVSAAV
ncbi:hypothetical protein SDC9_168633 [bioreactor metagenome]|uniref:Uncharacterized protein n=1 Tax=bioreactor metagenome TaxID=1076179 RepID=A0A645GB13_9ZZZZ